ncbi:MAG: elongation factor G-like protein EF-G2 [Pseudonocardia sp.]|nr:elongation factor G-like protein EF-G2 [Pseudonocardia sp.]
MAVKGDAGQGTEAITANDPTSIRNVVLVGPSGSGKTTLVEALLAATHVIPRAGTISDGSTICDHDPAAVRQQRSVALAVAPLRHRGHKINLVDTPGYGDFVGELRAGLRAADAALFVISAADGADPATVAQWEECAAVGMPRALVVARCDHQRADLEAAIASCQQAFGAGVLPLYLPTREGAELTGLYGLLSRTVGGKQTDNPPPDAEDARNTLIEGIIAESEDETLMERYLEGEEIELSTLISDLEKAVCHGSFHPVIPVCASSGIGLSELLELIVGGFPSPVKHALPAVTGVDGTAHPPLSADPAGPLAAEVVRTSADAYVGRVSLVRVFSGTLRPERSVHISGHSMTNGEGPTEQRSHDSDERLAHIYSPLGASLREVSSCVAGDICALTKLGTAQTGDTVSATDHPLLLAPWELPAPLLPVAVVAHSRGDEDALVKTLARLVAADPTLRLERNAETHQTVLWCMGEAHADVVLSRLRAGGAQVDTEPVRVAMRETLAKPGKVTGRHVKQSGGHGQFAVCHVEVEPLPRGSGFEFISHVVGGAVPTQYIPSVEKGVRAQMERGLTEGCPVVDLRVTLVDGKAHSVDSSDAAFQTAGALALREAAAKCGTIVLEPVDEIIVRIPDEHLGAVLGDLSSRRGRVLGTDSTATGTSPRTLVRAEVPAVELLRYAVDLRAMTSGTAVFTRHFVRYEAVPEHVRS